MPILLSRFAFKGCQQRSHKLDHASERQLGHDPARALCSTQNRAGPWQGARQLPLMPRPTAQHLPRYCLAPQPSCPSPIAQEVLLLPNPAQSSTGPASQSCGALVNKTPQLSIYFSQRKKSSAGSPWIVSDSTPNGSVYANMSNTFVSFVFVTHWCTPILNFNCSFEVEIYLVMLSRCTRFGLQNSLLPQHVHKPASPGKHLFPVTKTVESGAGQNGSGSNLMNTCIPDLLASQFSVFASWGRYCGLVLRHCSHACFSEY